MPAPPGSTRRAAASRAPAMSDDPPMERRRSQARASSSEAGGSRREAVLGEGGAGAVAGEQGEALVGIERRDDALRDRDFAGERLFDWLWLTSTTTTRSRRTLTGGVAPAGHSTGTRTVMKRSDGVARRGGERRRDRGRRRGVRFEGRVKREHEIGCGRERAGMEGDRRGRRDRR